MKIAVIILNYNNAEDTIACIESVCNSSVRTEIYVVDNNSTDDSFEKIKQRYDGQCIFIKSGKNLGYAGGNNLGIKAAEKDGCDYFCIANNDVEFERNTLEFLAEYLEKNQKVGAVGPAIIDFYDRNLVQSTGGMLNLYRGEVVNLNYNQKAEGLAEEYVTDYVGGACLMFGKNTLNSAGYLPESYFLFFEETEWCIRLKKKGFAIRCFSKAKVYHKGSATINTKQGLSEYLLERNRIRFVFRNGNVIQKISSTGYRCFYAIGKGLLVNRHFFCNLKYIFHGVFNIVDKKYPYIWINDKI